jgi:hypothetical protein
MTALTDLLARVEKATGPDRDGGKLAVKFAYEVTGIDPATSIMKIADDEWERWSFAFHRFGEAWNGSLDSALALVERMTDGGALSIESNPLDCYAAIYWPDFAEARRKDRCVALALLAALLRALVAREEDHE